MYHRPMIGKQ